MDPYDEERRMMRRHAAAMARGSGMPPGRPPKRPRRFATHDELLDAAIRMFESRAHRNRLESRSAKSGQRAAAVRKAAAWEKSWHRSFELTGRGLPFAERCLAAGLDRTERELVTILLLGRLMLIPDCPGTGHEAAAFMGLSGAGALAVYRSLAEGGRLAGSGLVTLAGEEAGEEEGSGAPLALDEELCDEVLHGGSSARRAWRVESEEELYARLRPLTRTCLRKCRLMAMAEEGGADGCHPFIPYRHQPSMEEELRKTDQKLARLYERLMVTLASNPGFRLNALLGHDGLEDRRDRLVLLALLGKELGHVAAASELFRGIGLASILARAGCGAIDVEPWLQVLRPDSALVSKNLIQPCGGDHMLAAGDENELGRTEFELAAKSLDILEQTSRRARRRRLDGRIRKPRVRMEQLVLPAAVRQALEMAAAQVRSSRTLALDWGLAEAVRYGTAVTLLFSGPPGTGKTASAEALAAELGREILVADYSEVQNCYVGSTEKNIVKVFRQAREAGAVLFWDEADAMFYDRDAAHYTWEARDVNVLLQELERFDGVCVLATNRKVSLDAALERRLSMKVEFPRPDRESRRKIWEKLLPAKMPLAGDVDLAQLAEPDLSGGEIKNVVLNAARLALARGESGPVAMSDFARALDMEVAGRWSGQPSGQMGFGRR